MRILPGLSPHGAPPFSLFNCLPNFLSFKCRLIDDSRIINKAFGEALALQLQALATLCIAIGIALSASWKMTLVTFCCTIDPNKS